MLKIVLDTNVIVSALLKSESNPALIVSLVFQDQLTLCLSKDIFVEYQGVLKRLKFKDLDQGSLKKLWTRLKNKALWVSPTVTLKMILEDPADNTFLECAQEVGADFLITGNIHHFSFKKVGKTHILTPGEFINTIAKLIIKEE
jgi:putative PIN family toxin of toxin-antitoxin system